MTYGQKDYIPLANPTCVGNPSIFRQYGSKINTFL